MNTIYVCCLHCRILTFDIFSLLFRIFGPFYISNSHLKEKRNHSNFLKDEFVSQS